MKTREERAKELQDWAASDRERQKLIDQWKKYNHEDPGHWQPAGGWDFPALIEAILRHEYRHS